MRKMLTNTSTPDKHYCWEDFALTIGCMFRRTRAHGKIKVNIAQLKVRPDNVVLEEFLFNDQL